MVFPNEDHNNKWACDMRQPSNTLHDLPDRKSHTGVAKPTVRQSCEKPGVLVVDEDHLVRIMVQLSLERNGFDVWLARNGREAIELYRWHTEEIAVVLLDVHTPDLDGLRTLGFLRELNSEVQACFMSCDTRTYEQLLQRDATPIISKPFLLDDLTNILRLIA